MSRIEEIEDAIDRLSPEEFRRLAGWVREREQRQWDEQLDSDASTCKLDLFLKKRKWNRGSVFFVTGLHRSEDRRHATILGTLQHFARRYSEAGC